jgi:hypothetical protein
MFSCSLKSGIRCVHVANEKEQRQDAQPGERQREFAGKGTFVIPISRYSRCAGRRGGGKTRNLLPARTYVRRAALLALARFDSSRDGREGGLAALARREYLRPALLPLLYVTPRRTSLSFSPVSPSRPFPARLPRVPFAFLLVVLLAFRPSRSLSISHE